MFMKTTGRPSNKSSNGTHAGRWTAEEHQKFLTALDLYGREWRKVAEHIQSRTSAQIRSHAQKYFAKLKKEAEAGIHGGVSEVHGPHVAFSPAARTSRKRSRSGTKAKKSGVGPRKVAKRPRKGKSAAGGRNFTPISSTSTDESGNISPNFTSSGDRGCGALSPRTTRISSSVHCHPVVRLWGDIEESTIKAVAELDKLHAAAAIAPHDYTISGKICAAEQRICQQYTRGMALPCMCRRMCLIVHCGKRRVAARSEGDTSRQLCLSVQRNVLSMIANVAPKTAELRKLVATKVRLNEEIAFAESAGDSISLQESAQLFYSLSREAQSTLEKLNETELTAVQVLIGTSIGLKPRKSPLRIAPKWSPRGPSPNVLPINLRMR